MDSPFFSARPSVISGDVSLANLVVPSPGFANVARLLNGSTDLITMPTAIYGLMQGLTALSMASWFNGSAAQSLVRFQSSSNDYADLVWSSGGGLPPNAILSWDSTTFGPRYSSSVAPASPQDSLWHHLCLTWLKGGTFFAYLDGAVANSQAAANVAAVFNTISFHPVIGNYQGSGSEQMAGACADCAVWGGVQLSGTDVANLASKRRANTVQAGSLLWYMPMVGQSPEPDFSGNGNSGTLTGTTIVTGPFS